MFVQRVDDGEAVGADARCLLLEEQLRESVEVCEELAARISASAASAAAVRQPLQELRQLLNVKSSSSAPSTPLTHRSTAITSLSGSKAASPAVASASNDVECVGALLNDVRITLRVALDSLRSLHARIDELEDDAACRESQLEANEAQMAADEQKIASLTAELRALRETVAAPAESAAQLRQSNERLSEQLVTVTNALDETRDVLQTTVEQAQQSASRVVELEAELEEARDEIHGKCFRCSADRLIFLNLELTVEVQRLSDGRGATLDDAIDLHAQLRTLKDELAQRERRDDDEIIVLTEQCEQAAAARVALEAELERERAENAELREQVAKNSAASTVATREKLVNDQLHAQLEKLRIGA